MPPWLRPRGGRGVSELLSAAELQAIRDRARVRAGADALAAKEEATQNVRA